MLKVAKFADKLLRKVGRGQKSGASILVNRGLESLGKDEKVLAKMVIENGLQSLNLGFYKASDIVPRILDVLG